MSQLTTYPTVHLTPEEARDFSRVDPEDTPAACKRHRNVVVLRSGMCLKRGLLIKESIHRYPHLYARFIAIAYGSRLRRDLAKADPDRTYLVLHNLWAGSYYHWITEGLARLRPVMDLRDRVTVLLPSHIGLRDPMVRSLACFGITEVEFFPPDKNVLVPDLILPDNPRWALPSRESVEFIRSHVLGAVGPGRAPEGAPRKIFISRARAPMRWIRNEEEVAGFLAARGYERVFLEDLAFEQQVRLMQGAEAVVAQRGAGLTNVMFMRPGTRVLELQRDITGRRRYEMGQIALELDPTFPHLAAKTGVHYYCLACTPTDRRQRKQVGDIIVDPDRLAAKLDLLEVGL